ncbi:ranBP-type and C3HC4-type zinc finger-containing protein 1 [Clupea harengus]|uniref:RanBP-type and C3HC4-type zinc finger-containing protein 1 n=1 Tax=Clupea harengus TaxID=7950 RepID=A0A6P8FCT7_CLUHA|nr:ranBP-type and C3HC4-type zinc finger-containing protein 1 [Clupea harengus]XP_031423289.1 ranBP-type and C3HC4-type zinc finger-containing protein 1 [Clupea harengus]XP_031423290.1 ranBP-type and C3HC4-type zinc finger-containing protein 1 [Clupea harengus]
MATPEVSNHLNEAENLAVQLSEAITCGDKDEAKQCAEKLAALYLPVSVKVDQKAYPPDTIRLSVGVEDAELDSSIPITMIVTVDMTISELKIKIKNDFGFHPFLQTWVIGKRLARDTDTLFNHGVSKDGDRAFLFIKAAKAAHLSREQQKQEAQHQRLDDIIVSMERNSLEPRGTGPPVAAKPRPPPLLPKPPQLLRPTIGWVCPMCTFLNKPTRPGCEICGCERPAGYKVPAAYQPDKDEVLRIQQEQAARLQYERALDEQRARNFHFHLETDSQNLIQNSEAMECPICFSTIEPGEGAVLRECLHGFCRECLKGTIINNMDAEVVCPYMCEDYSCNYKLLDREILSLLSQGEYQKFLELRLSIAESRSENSYHCKTPDCAGWCIYEDDVNVFECQRCQETNCLLCKAIHKDMDCQQYQDDLRIRAENDIAAKQTADALQALIDNGEAMYCPKCKVIVQKKDGCDWICCLMCKTEICWVMKQARWGPNGSGDTSGGCRCRVNNVPCHPNCNNCH